MPLSCRSPTAVGVNGKKPASPGCTISEIFAEFGMYSTTFGPTVLAHFVKPGSTFCSLPPIRRLIARKQCRPNVRLDADGNTTLPLYFGSLKAIHEVGGAQPFSANSFLLYAMPVMPSCTPAPMSSFMRANG